MNTRGLQDSLSVAIIVSNITFSWIYINFVEGIHNSIVFLMLKEGTVGIQASMSVSMSVGVCVSQMNREF